MIRVSRILIVTIKTVDAVKIQIFTRQNCYYNTTQRPREVIRFKGVWVELKGLK